MKRKLGFLLFYLIIALTSVSSSLSSNDFEKSRPTQFPNSGVSDNYSQTQRNWAKRIQGMVKGLREKNPFLEFIQANPSSTPFASFLRSYETGLLPFAVLGFVLFLLTLLGLIANCCKFECCKIRWKPNEVNRNSPFISVLICTVSLLVISGFAIGSSNAIGNRLEQIEKDSKLTFWEARTGNMNASWIGVMPLIQNFTQLSQITHGAIESLPAITSSSPKLNTLYKDLQTKSELYYTNNKDKKVANPRSEPISPVFIQKLGPTTDEKTYAGSILFEAQNKYNIGIQAMKNGNKSITELKSNNEAIVSAFSKEVLALKDLDTGLANNSNRIATALQKVVDVNESFSNSLFGSFIAFTVNCSFIVFLGLNVAFFKIPRFKHCIGFACFFQSLFILCAFLALALNLPVLIASGEICETSQVALTNKTMTQSLIQNYLTNKSNILLLTETCLFQDGNLLKALGLESQLTLFYSLNTLIDSVNQSIFIPPESLTIPPQLQLLPLVRDGKNYSNPQIETSLNQLNQFTNYQKTKSFQTCKESLDTWYLNHGNCSTIDGKAFSETDPANFNYKKATCIGFDVFESSTGADRYTEETFANCPNVSAQEYSSFVAGYIQEFQNHFSDVSGVFTKLLEDLNEVNQANTAFVKEEKTILKSLVNTDGNALKVVDMIGDEDIGIFKNSNCSITRRNVEAIVDGFCIGYVNNIFVVSLLTFLFAVISLIFVCCLRRLERVEKWQELVDDEKQILLKMDELY